MNNFRVIQPSYKLCFFYLLPSNKHLPYRHNQIYKLNKMTTKASTNKSNASQGIQTPIKIKKKDLHRVFE